FDLTAGGSRRPRGKACTEQRTGRTRQRSQTNDDRLSAIREPPRLCARPQGAALPDRARRAGVRGSCIRALGQRKPYVPGGQRGLVHRRHPEREPDLEQPDSGDRIAGTRSLFVQMLTRLRYLSQTAEPVQVLRTAVPPSSAISPKPTRNALLGLLIGVTLGILAAFVRDALDRRLKASTDIAQSLGWPILANVREEAMGRAGLVSVNGRGPTKASDFEDFRILRKNLQFLDVE